MILTSCSARPILRRSRWNATSSRSIAPSINILLKDDKHYPYLRIDLNEPFPRLTLARNMDDQRAA